MTKRKGEGLEQKEREMKIGVQMMAVLAAGMASAASLEREGTCGVYSPDGSRILCARAVDGKSRLVLIEKDGQEKLVETGPGHAAFPAWHPSGEGFVYTCGNETKSAWQAFQEKSATGCHLRYRTLAGVDRELTTGRHRDSMPGFSPDGKTLYFASTRCAEPEVFKASKTGLYSMPFDGGEPTCLLPARVNCQAYGQPAVSPDGRYLVWAEMDGFSDGWHLNLAKRDRLDVVHRLTPPLQSAYAPRWSPDGRTIVYTGFLPDDPGWCVYAIDPRSGRYERLCEGRNPDVHPSGREILYDDGTLLHTRGNTTSATFGRGNRLSSSLMGT